MVALDAVVVQRRKSKGAGRARKTSREGVHLSWALTGHARERAFRVAETAGVKAGRVGSRVRRLPIEKEDVGWRCTTHSCARPLLV